MKKDGKNENVTFFYINLAVVDLAYDWSLEAGPGAARSTHPPTVLHLRVTLEKR